MNTERLVRRHPSQRRSADAAVGGLIRRTDHAGSGGDSKEPDRAKACQSAAKATDGDAEDLLQELQISRFERNRGHLQDLAAPGVEPREPVGQQPIQRVSGSRVEGGRELGDERNPIDRRDKTLGWLDDPPLDQQPPDVGVIEGPDGHDGSRVGVPTDRRVPIRDRVVQADHHEEDTAGARAHDMAKQRSAVGREPLSVIDHEGQRALLGALHQQRDHGPEDLRSLGAGRAWPAALSLQQSAQHRHCVRLVPLVSGDERIE